MKEGASIVLAALIPSTYTEYASVVRLPTALLDDLFDRPCCWRAERSRLRLSLSQTSLRRAHRLLSLANDG